MLDFTNMISCIQEFGMINFIVGSLVCCLLFKWIEINLKRYSHFKNVPGPRTWDYLFGHFLYLLKTLPLEPHKEWYEAYKHHPNYNGLLVYQGVFGAPRLYICEPELFYHIFASKPYIFGKNMSLAGYFKQIFGQKGVLLADGKEHQNIKKILNPVFHSDHVQKLIPLFSYMAKNLTTHWKTLADEGKDGKATVDICKESSKTTLDILISGVIDASLTPDSIQKRTIIADAYRFLVNFYFTNFYIKMRHLLPFIKYLPIENGRIFQEAKKNLHNLTLYAVAESKSNISGNSEKSSSMNQNPDSLLHDDQAHMNENHSILKTLLQKLADTNNPLDNETIKDQILTIVMAGHETTSVALNWSLHLLATHPHIQDELRDHLNAQDNIVDYAQKKNTYLDYLVKEVLRLRRNLSETVF